MPKPVIAVDIDDVLLESAPAIVAEYNRCFGTRLTLHNFYATTYDREVWGNVDESTAIQRVDSYAQSDAFVDRGPVQEALGCLRELAEDYELHVLTGRNDIVTEMTVDWLERYFPAIFSSVNFANIFSLEKKRSKGEMCVEMGASFLIDDDPRNLKSAVEHGLRAVLFGNYPWSRTDTLPSEVARCADWPEVLEYFDGIS